MTDFDDGWNSALEALAVFLEGRVEEILEVDPEFSGCEWVGALETAIEDARSLKKERKSPLQKG